jgi:hypothetical protein
MPGIMESVEQRPELLIAGAVSIGVLLYVYVNRSQSSPLPKASGPTQVQTSPATDTVSLGTVQQQIKDYQDYEQQWIEATLNGQDQSQRDWILQQLEQYYGQYNGQPPYPAPRTPASGCGNPGQPPCGQGGGSGNYSDSWYETANATATGIGGDSPAAPALVGQRFDTYGLRSFMAGFWPGSARGGDSPPGPALEGPRFDTYGIRSYGSGL